MALALLLPIAGLAAMLVACHDDTVPRDVITQNERFTVGPDMVIDGEWTARAMSGTHLVTSYEPPLGDSVPAVIKVRLAINRHDNELRPGEYHYIDLTGDAENHIVKACVADKKRFSSPPKIECPKELRLKIDLTTIKNAMSEKGFFVTPTHDTIYADDYKGVWLTAVDDQLNMSLPELLVDTMPSKGGIHSVTVNLSHARRQAPSQWKAAAPNANYPVYESNQKLMDVIHNLSIEEIAKDNASSHDHFLVAQECYAIALALAYLEPQRSMQSLKAMVRDSIITTGDSIESYNSLVNKMIWATAAWQVYCATADNQWLRFSHDIIVKNLADIENSGLLNTETRLYRATCPYYLSNSNQYYPPWASITDIFETTPLIANAIMEHTYRLVEMMNDDLGIVSHSHKADAIKDAINHRLWDEYKGCYSQYLYGGTLNMMSPCTDNMGQALCVLWDIADDNRGQTLVNNMHLGYYGVSLTYPINPNVRPQVNDAFMPMVQALWNIAAARNGNMAMLRRGIGALIRPQALLASCDVSTTATTGDPLDISYSRGNAAGNLAMFYNVIAGITFLPEGLEFTPKVPVCFEGKKTIKALKYRNAVLDITIEGTGNELSKISLDGKNLADNFIPGNISGHHSIVITMNGIYTGSGKITVTKDLNTLPETPLWQWDGYYGTTYNYNDNNGYKILINGETRYSMRDSVLGTRDTMTYRSFALVAVNKYGLSYASKPHFITTTATWHDFATHNPKHILHSPPLPGHYRHHPIEMTDTSTAWIEIPVTTTEAGDYVIDVLYSNGNTIASLASPCQMLEVATGGHLQGVLVTPQLGTGQWLATALSSSLNVKLLKGNTTLRLRMHRPQWHGGPPSRLRLHQLRVIKR